MLAKLILLFMVELWLLLSIGDLIGFWPTAASVVAAGFLGVALGKWEVHRVLGAWREAVSQGRAPDEGLTSGLLVVVGAALLVVPGFLSDLVGLVLLFPPTRRWIAPAVQARMERRFAAGGGFGGVRVASVAGEGGGAPWSEGGGAPWSVRVMQIGDPLGAARVAWDEGDGGDAGERGWPRREVIDVEAESVVVEEDGAPRRKEPARLPR